jgi:hypothetical protein
MRPTPLFRIVVAPTSENGLQKPSQVMVDKASTFPRDKIGRRIGALDGEIMLAVNRRPCRATVSDPPDYDLLDARSPFGGGRLYGVQACAVAERTREIGIRMALGAEKSDITRMVLRRSLLLVTVGVSLGVAGALAVTRVLAKFLFEVKPTDLPTFLVVAALLVAVALLSGLLPAQRAATVDPLIALRWE